MVSYGGASLAGEPAVRFIGEGTLSRDPDADKLMQAVCHLPGIRRITALPDFAVDGPEKADSWVVELKGWVVPALATNVINCGIGLIDTGLKAGDVSAQEMKGFLSKVWETSCSEDYTLTRDQVDSMFLEGVGSLTRRGWLSREEAGAFEFGGSALPNGNGDAAGLDLDDIIPQLMRRLPQTRRPVRLELGGNHFVELQVVEEAADPERLRALGLKEGQLVMMVHTDHRVTGNINLHYTLRQMYFHKPLWRRAAYFLAKGWFHFGNPAHWRQAAQRWRYYFQQRDFARLPADSPEGRRYLAAYNLATNYGYAARAVIYRMCLDVLKGTFGHQAAPRLLCDTNHESIRVREEASGPVVVVRKGAVECLPTRPALIAGSYDVPSLLGECIGSDETAFSYDHGSANFRERFGESGETLGPTGATMRRYVPSSTTGGLVEAREQQFPVRSKLSMEALVNLLSARQAVRPVAWLRPVANLSQR